MNNLTEERIAICTVCPAFSELKTCTAGCCPHMGQAAEESSRCPQNKWPDGWGTQVPTPISESVTTQGTIYTDLEQNRLVTEEEEEIAKEIAQDPTHIFSSEAEVQWFVKMKMILSL